jgi:EmrB/QacA subfamily drug resistance transporter
VAVDTVTRRTTGVALFVLLSGSLLSMIDSSVVNVAVPDISRELSAPLSAVQWTVSGYLLAIGATLPATAYLGRRFGNLRVYAISLAVFIASSLLCALAPSIAILIAARIIQGVAAAPLVPISMNLLFGRAGVGSRDFPVSAGLVLFLGPALGPTVGGLFVTAWGWPSIFFVNLPIGLAALAGVPRLRRLGYGGGADASARFDPVGLALLCAGLAGVVYGASEAPTHGWFSAGAGPFWLAGLALTAGYVAWARWRPDPALDLELLRRGRSALALVLCVLASVAMFGVLFLLPVLIQSIQGHGALASGLVLLPQGLVMGLSTKIGFNLTGARLRRAIVLGCTAIALTGAALALVDLHTPLWIIALVMAGRGLGIGLVIQPLLTGMLVGLPERELAHANTLFNVGQRLGGSLGVGLLATLYTTRVTAGAGPLGGLHETVLAAAGVAVVAIVVAAFVRPVMAAEVRVVGSTASALE